MKILYITNIASPYRVDFFNELNKYCELTVLFERKKANDRNDKWYGKKYTFESYFLKSISIGNESSMSIEIIKYLKKDYDVIVLGGYSSFTAMIASVYMKIHKIPYVLNADGGFVYDKEKKLKKYIKKFFISSAQYWLSSGEETNKYLRYYGANKNKIFNFPFTSLKKSEILKEPITVEMKKKLKIKYNIPYKKVILSVGQFIPRKGYDWMIEAYKDLSHDVGIYIIGGKPIKEYLDLKAKYKMENLHFVDFQDKSKLKIWYQMADLFVLPTREDIWGLVINEAMSQGLPIITTYKCNAGLELVRDGKNGYLVKNDDKDDLYVKTTKILEKDSYSFGKYSLLYINNYTIENMAETTYKLLKSLV